MLTNLRCGEKFDLPKPVPNGEVVNLWKSQYSLEAKFDPIKLAGNEKIRGF